MKLILLIISVLTCNILSAQPQFDWNTVGGNSQRNGRSGFTGPGGEFEVLRRNSIPTIWGNQIYIEGNKLVTTRYTSLNPVRALLACHSANFMIDTLWTRNYSENGVMIVMGFRDGKIYARNFQQQGFDTIYAINPQDGSVIWKSRHTVERGIIWSAAFADNGDLILPGSGTKSVMRINHITGDTVWTRYRIIPNTGAECMCIYDSTVYTFEGGLTTPKRLMAIDIETGSVKYYSVTLPGDGDQEIPFSIGKDGTIYVVRDGGGLHALRDTGNGFIQLWVRSLPGAVGTYSTFGILSDDDVLIGAGRKIYRIENVSGASVDSTEDLISSGTLNARIAVDAADNIYAGNGASVPAEGKYFAFDRFLNTMWSDPMPYNYYSGPALGYGDFPGVYYCGAGSEITRVADFASINSQSELIPSGIDLLYNYPNPFNPSTKVRFELTRTQQAVVEVYDLLGNLAEVIHSGRLVSGLHEFKWNAGDRSSGVYICRVKTESGSAVRKMMLVR